MSHALIYMAVKIVSQNEGILQMHAFVLFYLLGV